MNLDEIRARAEATTEGPWEADCWEVYGPDRRWVAETHDPDNIDQCERDAEFIAHVRRDIPNLLALVDSLTAENARLRSQQPDVEKLRELAGALNRMHAKRPLANYTGYGDALLAAIGEEPGYMGQPLRVEEASLPLAELLVLHEWDELVFGGFICLKCTPDDAAIPEENVYWPCPPLREAGLTDEQARDVVLRHRAVVEARARGEATLAPEGGAW